MGIRFLCHNCEKRLNVKSSQAGREGQCPSCGETVLIPHESTILSLEEKQRRQQVKRPKSNALISLHSVDEQDTAEGELPVNTATRGTAAVARKKSRTKAASPNKNNLSDSFMLDKPARPDTFGKVDPIAEAPKKIWYFRSKALGERGPLKGPAMRKHVDDGDVTIGCIVWREDWDDWVPAEQVFPTLVAKAKENRKKARINRAFKDANYQIPDEMNPHSDINLAKRRKNQIFIGAIGIGLLIVFGLSMLLIKLVSA